jgi:hypothetical protein
MAGKRTGMLEVSGEEDEGTDSEDVQIDTG